jgi:Cu(I)/Ag(I) efflux system membrane fusion protein
MRVVRIMLIVVAVAAAFFAGRWYAVRAPRTPQRKVLYWVDPMHPAYKSDKPGIAPDCGMKLVPVYAGEAPPTEAKTPAGTVQISAEKQQLIGVRYGTAEITAGAEAVRATGKVAIDETRVSHVHSRTEGWIDKVYADFTGDVVHKGQALVTLYSPDLLATEQEYLLAIEAREAMRNSPIQGVAADSASLVEASRRRLQLWDLSERQIEELERSQKPVTNTTLYAPASGYVMARNAFPNQRITPDTELYTVVDLEPRVGAGKHLRVPGAAGPRGPGRRRVAALRRRPELERARQLHTAAGGCANAHHPGANRAAQSGARAQAGDVRQRRAAVARRPRA